MKQVDVLKYEVFIDVFDLGNFVGIVFNGDDYLDEEMQMIVEMVGYNEILFFCKSGEVDLKICYFIFGYEMNLCGYVIVVFLYVLIEKGKFQVDQMY